MSFERFKRITNKLMGVKPRIDPRTSETPIYANFQDRLVAGAIDIALLFIVFQDLFKWLFSLRVQHFSPEDLSPPATPEFEFASTPDQIRMFVEHLYEIGFAQVWLENIFYQSVIIGIAFVTMWHMFQTTPGKYLIGLKIVEKTTFAQPSLKQYIMRYLGFYLSMPPFMIGFATLGFFKHNQAWHDQIAGTVVVYTREGSIFRRAWDWVKVKIKRPANDN